jgi:CDP-glycerol glycerophosphotransferase
MQYIVKRIESSGRVVFRLIASLILSVIPINLNKIFVVSFYGRGYSDSPKYIVQALLNQKLPYKIYWAIKDTDANNGLPSEVYAIKFNSLKHIYHMCTSGIWIDNSRKPAFTKKNKKQLYIQTWHGLPNKRIEKDALAKLENWYVKSAIRDSKICDLLISNSTFLTSIYKSSFWYDGPILESGFPRNDILRISKSEISNKVKLTLGIGKNKKVMLYAPTFRKNAELDSYNLNYEGTIRALSAKFGGNWTVLIRLHPNIADRSSELIINNKSVIDASSYLDMQELLVAADVLITDYSSSLFDYIITKKPCFMFATDLQEYRNDRDLYFEFTDLPFELSENNDDLNKAILAFDQISYSEKCEKFMKTYGFYETGDASNTVAEWIMNNSVKNN